MPGLPRKLTNRQLHRLMMIMDFRNSYIVMDQAEMKGYQRLIELGLARDISGRVPGHDEGLLVQITPDELQIIGRALAAGRFTDVVTMPNRHPPRIPFPVEPRFLERCDWVKVT